MLPYNTPIKQTFLHEQLTFLKRGNALSKCIYVSDRLWLRFHPKNTIEITVFELNGKMKTKFGTSPDTIGELMDRLKEMGWSRVIDRTSVTA